jgi:hypothetical protein
LTRFSFRKGGADHLFRNEWNLGSLKMQVVIQSPSTTAREGIKRTRC